MRKWSKGIEWVVVLVVVGGFFYSGIRWAKLNSPVGKFENVEQYLEYGRMPSWVLKMEEEGEVYFVAMGPVDTWFALPSGPPVYVFDGAGKLVDWVGDSGEAPEFYERWVAPGKESSIEALKALVGH